MQWKKNFISSICFFVFASFFNNIPLTDKCLYLYVSRRFRHNTSSYLIIRNFDVIGITLTLVFLFCLSLFRLKKYKIELKLIRLKVFYNLHCYINSLVSQSYDVKITEVGGCLHYLVVWVSSFLRHLMNVFQISIVWWRNRGCQCCIILLDTLKYCNKKE